MADRCVVIRRAVAWTALGAVAVAAVVAAVVCLPLLLIGAVVNAATLRRRPDPVDVHWLTAAAVLAPDDLPDPGWCACRDCAPELYEEIR